MNQSDRFALQTDTINGALQHDLVLYGDATADYQLVFGWRSASGRFGPQFTDRELAIDWLAEWLDEEAESGRFQASRNSRSSYRDINSRC
jgi:hypothetical protein